MNSITGIGEFDLGSVSNMATQAAWEESNSTSGVMEWLLPIFPEKATTCARQQWWCLLSMCPPSCKKSCYSEHFQFLHLQLNLI